MEQLEHMGIESDMADSQVPAFATLDYSARPVAGSRAATLDTAGLQAVMARNIPEKLDGAEFVRSKLEGIAPVPSRGMMSTVPGRRWEWATLSPLRQWSLQY